MPRVVNSSTHAAERVGDLVGEVLAARVQLGGGVAEEAGERRGPHARAAVRLLERLEQAQPLHRRRGGEHAAAAGDHRGDADLLEGRAGVGQVGVAVADHRDVAGPDRLAGVRRTRREQPAYVEGEVAGDVGPDLAGR